MNPGAGDPRRRRVLAQLALGSHPRTPIAEARAALDGVDHAIAAADGELDDLRLRAATARITLGLRSIGEAIEPVLEHLARLKTVQPRQRDHTLTH